MTSTSLPPRAIALLAVGVAGLALAIAGEPTGVAGLRVMLAAVSAVPVLVGSYDRWLWRWLPGGPPVLSGTWRCIIRPAANGGGQASEIESFVSIRQTARDLHVTLMTSESRSGSIASAIRREAGGWNVSWIYQNESRPAFRERSPIHFGGARLDGFHERRPRRAAGTYWTDRRTAGEIEIVARVSTSATSTFEDNLTGQHN